MILGACPECDADVPFKKQPQEGQKVNCPECGAALWVIGETPIELDWDPAVLDMESMDLYDEDYEVYEG